MGNTYWVEGLEYVASGKNLNVNVPMIGIVGQDKAIERIMWSVFEPRQISSTKRLKLSKFISDFTIQFEFII